MNLTPYYEKSLFACSVDDQAKFAAFTEHLPIREDLTPFHCGPHSLRSMRIAYEFCGKPKNVLEVGFCLGHSTEVWFGLGAEKVTSIENSTRPQTMESAKKVKGRHSSAFHFLNTTSDKLLDHTGMVFGMMFIDGGHEFDDVSKDITLGLELRVPFLLLDDWFPKWGPGVQPAVEHHKLIPIAVIGNMALCVQGNGWK